MGIYDAFKDALNVAQKADNVELYRKLLDLSAQALDLQAENARLKEENTELRKIRDLEQWNRVLFDTTNHIFLLATMNGSYLTALCVGPRKTNFIK